MSRKTTLLHEVMRADKEYTHDKTLEPEYEFPNKRFFYGITAKRGAYADYVPPPPIIIEPPPIDPPPIEPPPAGAVVGNYFGSDYFETSYFLPGYWG